MVVAPADGRILYVKRAAAGDLPRPAKHGRLLDMEEWGDEISPPLDGYLVGIYMTPLSVHYNRAPVAGKVAKVAKRAALRGENISMVRALVRLIWGMDDPEALDAYVHNNARNTIVIEGAIRTFLTQIADRYVDEIDCFVSEGDRVEQGQKLGLIRMGSQCDFFVPSSCKLLPACAVGQKTVAGETVLAEYI